MNNTEKKFETMHKDITKTIQSLIQKGEDRLDYYFTIIGIVGAAKDAAKEYLRMSEFENVTLEEWERQPIQQISEFIPTAPPVDFQYKTDEEKKLEKEGFFKIL